ncbi:hypothetical protein GCM10010349_38790 [Streptomyces flavofungini]|nr:hypothetical protein GCM10010349_38790 [Streptomyces flavofungini]
MTASCHQPLPGSVLAEVLAWVVMSLLVSVMCWVMKSLAGTGIPCRSPQCRPDGSGHWDERAAGGEGHERRTGSGPGGSGS